MKYVCGGKQFLKNQGKEIFLNCYNYSKMVAMSEMNSTQDILLILLLIITEILPFVHNARANGLLHLIYIVLAQFLSPTIEMEVTTK